MKKKFLIKMAAVLVFCAVLFSSVPAAPLTAEATTLSELQNRLEQLKDQEADIKAELSEIRQDVANQQAYKNQLSYQINNINSQISTMNQRVSTLNKQIEEKTVQIEETQQKMDESHDLMLRRLRAMYLSDDATLLSVLFGSSSFAEFLSMSETISRIAEHDDALIKELAAQKKQIEEDKAAIEASKEQIEEDRAALAKKQDELDAARDEAGETLAEKEALEAKVNKTYKEILAGLEATDREIEAYIKQNQSGGQLSAGGWLWPVPGYTRISSGFGWRILNGERQYHKGIDIPCAKNHPIRAAKDGTVIRADFSSSYGNIVIIDHGGGYSTVYAHNNSLKVSYGQQVKQGQTIALAGTTGWSYGVHCHFEVRINGVVQQPLNYVVATG